MASDLSIYVSAWVRTVLVGLAAVALIAAGAVIGPHFFATKSQAAPPTAADSTVWDVVPDFADITDATFRDLGAPGPTVTVKVGESGIVEITLSATMSSAGETYSGGMMSIELSGANVVEASSDRALSYSVSGSSWTLSSSRTILLTGLQPGMTTITAKYATVADRVAVGFSDRILQVTVL